MKGNLCTLANTLGCFMLGLALSGTVVALGEAGSSAIVDDRITVFGKDVAQVTEHGPGEAGRELVLAMAEEVLACIPPPLGTCPDADNTNPWLSVYNAMVALRAGVMGGTITAGYLDPLIGVRYGFADTDAIGLNRASAIANPCVAIATLFHAYHHTISGPLPPAQHASLERCTRFVMCQMTHGNNGCKGCAKADLLESEKIIRAYLGSSAPASPNYGSCAQYADQQYNF